MYVRDFLFLAFSLIALYFHYFLIKELYLEKSATLLFFFFFILLRHHTLRIYSIMALKMVPNYSYDNCFVYGYDIAMIGLFFQSTKLK